MRNPLGASRWTDNTMTRKLIIFILLFNFGRTFGQKTDSIPTKIISGTVIDSLTNEPIAFMYVFTDKTNMATTDQDGNFRITISADTNVSINVFAVGYEKKTIKLLPEMKQIAIKLKSIPFDPEKEFILRGNPIDTIYYKNGKIQTIKYQYQDEISFYENGQIKSKTVNGSNRSWYKNGKLEYQSILKFNHFRTQTEWFDNGQMKECGTMHWGHNQKTNAGDWFKNNDWQYWDKSGKEIKK